MRLAKLLKWDFLFQARYGIIIAAIIMAVVWLAIIALLPVSTMGFIIPIAFLTDFAVTGFLFVAAMVFFDKGQGTLEAIITSPIKVSEYIMSKLITLSVLICGIALVLVLGVSGLKGLEVNYFFGILASLLASAFFILLGLIITTFYKSFTDLLMPMGGLFAILFIPFLIYIKGDFLPFFDYIVFLWPTYWMLVLIDAVLGKVDTLFLVLGILYLVALTSFLYKVAIKIFNNRIIGREADIDG